MHDDGEDPSTGVPEVRDPGDVAAAAEAFEHLPFLVVVTEGPDLRTVAVNAALRSATDDRLERGVPLADTLPPDLTGQGWVEAFATPTLTGRPVLRREQRVRVHRPDGSVHEVYLDAVLVPRPGPDGAPRGTIGVATDVTERVLEREAARRDLEELRAQQAVARRGVNALQRVLLPDTVPVLPAFDVAARYLPASDDEAAGGDWFDAVPREDGSVVVVVGDVVGHGDTAAVAMGQLRSVLRSQLLAGVGPAPALEFLDAFAATLPAAHAATVCLALLTADGDVEYCTAGHPPPLVLTGDGRSDRYLPPSGAGPLATGGRFPTARAHLAQGEALVLCSDGILERPGTTPTAAAVDLLVAAAGALRGEGAAPGSSATAAERICAGSIDLLTRTSGHTDDITVLAVQRRTAVPDLDVELPTAPSSLREARTVLRSWLTRVGAGVQDLEILLSAATELVANSVDHAHLGGRPEPFRVRARLGGDGRVVLDVVDGGSWKFPVVTSGRGRGLALVRGSVDDLEMDRSPSGTTARVRHALRRPAGLLHRTPPPVRPPADPEHFDVWSRGGPEPVVTVVGPLDGAGTAETASHLTLALTEAGSVVTVDLGRVTLLASAGVDLLFRVLEQARDAGLGVDLLAPVGSPAQHVLSLVQLPFVPVPPPEG